MYAYKIKTFKQKKIEKKVSTHCLRDRDFEFSKIVLNNEIVSFSELNII